jgi:hypothetical protein
MMNNKDILALINLAKDRLKNPVSKEEALHTFINAGILDKNTNFTYSYPYLRKYMNNKNKLK